MLKNPAYEALSRLLGRLIPNAGSWSGILSGLTTIDSALNKVDQMVANDLPIDTPTFNLEGASNVQEALE